MNIASPMITHVVTIDRPDPASSIFSNVTGLAIRAGTTIQANGVVHGFDIDTPVAVGTLIPGEDYGVRLSDDGKPFASLLGPDNPIDAGWIGGFHYALGGGATALNGGDTTPTINPCSVWDINFRPSCPDPRGMALVEADGRRFWVDIYLLGVDHRKHGTSRCGVRIADGSSLDRLNYHDAVAIVMDNGKRLPTYDEFRAAASGVTEKSAAAKHPKATGLDAARTSRFGLMQATGNLWVWGTDGDPDDPRPSIFGGSWLNGSSAGSRYAHLGDWAGSSNVYIGARAASDHLAPE